MLKYSRKAPTQSSSNLSNQEINKIEAQNLKLFAPGWPPFVGCVCGRAMASYYIPKALVGTALWSWQCVKIISIAADITKVTLPIFPVVFG